MTQARCVGRDEVDRRRPIGRVEHRTLGLQEVRVGQCTHLRHVEAGRLGLRASGSVLRFPGWLKVYGRDEDDEAEEGGLPDLQQGWALTVAAEALAKPADDGEPAAPVRPEQHFTQPPPRYTDASLVKALEEENIGRPSTYATIVSTITKRDYIEREGRSLKPTDLGMLVTGLLVGACTVVGVLAAYFGLRGVKVLLDGIPQSLPDGQSQLTNIDLAAVDRVERTVAADQAREAHRSSPRRDGAEVEFERVGKGWRRRRIEPHSLFLIVRANERDQV